MHIRLATRGSALALWQAQRVTTLILKAVPTARVDLVVITTTADRLQDRPLRDFGDKALFVKEIEDALLDGRADAAIHSLKDVPGELPDGLILAATPERAAPHDVLISRHGGGLAGLSKGAVVATSSARRRGQVLRLRPDLQVTDIRGNVDTRIRKVREGQYDAMILAAAGLHRLGLVGEISEVFSPEVMVPAPTQGILALETPAKSPFGSLWQTLDDRPTRTAAEAEREFVRAVGADCRTPAGCYLSLSADHQQVHLRAMVCSLDGASYLAIDLAGPSEQSRELARAAAHNLLERGAAGIIKGAHSIPPRFQDHR